MMLVLITLFRVNCSPWATCGPPNNLTQSRAAATFHNKAWRAYRTESRVAIPSGGYWVRQMRQLPWAPLENTTYSFILLYMFF